MFCFLRGLTCIGSLQSRKCDKVRTFKARFFALIRVLDYTIVAFKENIVMIKISVNKSQAESSWIKFHK